MWLYSDWPSIPLESQSMLYQLRGRRGLPKRANTHAHRYPDLHAVRDPHLHTHRQPHRYLNRHFHSHAWVERCDLDFLGLRVGQFRPHGRMDSGLPDIPFNFGFHSNHHGFG